jgi:hypothetical protein
VKAELGLPYPGGDEGKPETEKGEAVVNEAPKPRCGDELSAGCGRLCQSCLAVAYYCYIMGLFNSLNKYSNSFRVFR